LQALNRSVRLIEPSELPQARDVLIRAFIDDPIVRYFMPNPHKAALLLHKLDTDVLRVALSQQNAFTLTDGLHGVMVRVLPGDKALSLFDLLRPSALPLIAQLGIFWIPRGLLYLLLTERMQAKLVPEPHIYLFTLGVDPACQSAGRGNCLLACLTQTADEKRLPMYLETFSPRAVALYERHGFRIARTQMIPLGGPQCWFMRRDARQGERVQSKCFIH
jgi:ribosomal protein S18 acetylase RimI-like enzyme